MEYSIAHLPLLCQQLLQDRITPRHVGRWLPRARQEWRQHWEGREQSHQRWVHELRHRPAQVLLHEARTLAREQLVFERGAIEHLGRFVHTRWRPELVHASAHWRRAELAEGRYHRKFQQMWREMKAS